MIKLDLKMYKCTIFRRQKLSEKEEFSKLKGSTLLSDDTEDLAGIQYRPKTRESKATYEVLLTFIQAAIGDQVNSDVDQTLISHINRLLC